MVPAEKLAKKKTVSHELLPFRIETVGYFENSQLKMLPQQEDGVATQGLGKQVSLTPLNPRYDDNYRNMISVYIKLYNGDTELGTWLVSTGLGKAQAVTVKGETYRILLRPTRYYQNFSITLNDFQHDKYAGTNIPKNFASEVVVTDKMTNSAEQSLIYMNHPLRHDGLTFYQASFGKEDTLSVFQVVKNPGWLLPYVSTTLMSVGLCIHFFIHLFGYLKRKRKRSREVIIR